MCPGEDCNNRTIEIWIGLCPGTSYNVQHCLWHTSLTANMEMLLLVTRQHTLKIYVLPTTHIMLRFAAVWHQSRSPTSFRVASGYYHPGAQFNIKMTSYQYRKSHCGDKTAVRSSNLHNGIFYTGKMSSLYWIRAQVPISESGQCNSSHYSDVIMSVMASQITSVSLVCTTVRVRVRVRKLYLMSDSVNSTTLALTWNEC